MKKEKWKGVVDVTRALILSLLFSLLLVLAIAIVAKYAPMSNTLATVLNQVVKVLSVLLGCLVGFRSRRFGWLMGGIVGLLFTLVSFALFSLISGHLDFAKLSVFDFLLGAASGICSGILSVNVHSIERKPRRKRAANA